MRKGYVVGIGQTPVQEHWDRSTRDLAADSMLQAMAQASIDKADAIYVGNALSGELTGQEQVAALVADFAGLTGTEAVRVEAAGASGGAAVRLGYLAVASGVHDTVMVTGMVILLVTPATTAWIDRTVLRNASFRHHIEPSRKTD